MTEGDMRRNGMIRFLREHGDPVCGADLAREFGVSRQVIVQDIALLRATNKNILSTNKGYMLYRPDGDKKRARRSFYVRHTDAQMKDELYAIVDCGGKVLDVIVEHDIYGQINVDLVLNNRLDVDEFVERLRGSGDAPLSTLTGGEHWHTVEADSERILDVIGEKLREKGYLAE